MKYVKFKTEYVTRKSNGKQMHEDDNKVKMKCT